MVLAFCSALFKRHLLVTNLTVSFAFSGLGDYLEQKREFYQKKTNAHSQISLRRSLHMSLTFGLTSGVLCHYWYNFLDRVIPGSGIRIAVRKIVYDQFLFSPLCIGSCLVVDNICENQLWNEQIVRKGTSLYIADCVLWPPAQFINFYCLPTRFRVLFDSVVSVIFDVYTSHVKYYSVHDNELAK